MENSKARLSAIKTLTMLAEVAEGRRKLLERTDIFQQCLRDPSEAVKRAAEIAIRVIRWKPFWRCGISQRSIALCCCLAVKVAWLYATFKSKTLLFFPPKKIICQQSYICVTGHKESNGEKEKLASPEFSTRSYFLRYHSKIFLRYKKLALSLFISISMYPYIYLSQPVRH